jgi:hypothetical protein
VGKKTGKTMRERGRVDVFQRKGNHKLSSIHIIFPPTPLNAVDVKSLSLSLPLSFIFVFVTPIAISMCSLSGKRDVFHP